MGRIPAVSRGEDLPMSQGTATMMVPRVQFPPAPGPSVTAAPAASTIQQLQEQPLIDIRALSVFYGQHEAIKRATLTLPEHRVIAFIGPSGCGKSTLLRSINRLNDLIPGCRVTGELSIGGTNVYDPNVDLVSLRRQVGLVFQKPNPF